MVLLSILCFGYSIYNLIMWILMKKKGIKVKATVIENANSMVEIQSNNVLVKYTVNGVDYETTFMVKNHAYLSNGNPGDTFDIYVLKNMPEVRVSDINQTRDWFIFFFIAGLGILGYYFYKG